MSLSTFHVIEQPFLIEGFVTAMLSAGMIELTLFLVAGTVLFRMKIMLLTR